MREFRADKYQDYEKDIEPTPKVLSGWGRWAGPNIGEKKVNVKAEIKRKMEKIEEIKRQRRDADNDNVIINHAVNRNVQSVLRSLRSTL